MESKKEQLKEQVESIIEYSRMMYERRLVSAAGGNISFRCGNNILITASGAPLRCLNWDDILLCGMDGRVIEGGKGKKPSKEYRIHLSCYKARPEITCVFHLHPSYSIAFTVYDRPLPLYTASAKLKLKQVPIVPEAYPGSQELAEKTLEAVKAYPQCRAFLLKAHGILVMEQSMELGFETAELVEDTAKIAILGIREWNSPGMFK